MKGDTSSVAGPAPRRQLSSRRALPLVVRYALVGGVTQAIYLIGLVAAMSAGAHYFVAIGVAQLVAIAFAFPTYRAWVFSADGPLLRQFTAFLGVWWSGALASLIGVPTLVEVVGMTPLVAQLLVMTTVALLSFAGHVGITFRPRPSRPRHQRGNPETVDVHV
jgi:putative flippase GtrA